MKNKKSLSCPTYKTKTQSLPFPYYLFFIFICFSSLLELKMVEPAGNIAGVMSAVIPVGKWLAAPIWRQFMYMYNYKTNFDNLEKEVGKLKFVREKVQDKVKDATNNLEMIELDVQNWLDNVNSAIVEADELLEQKVNNSGCSCLNPSLITRYKHGKKTFKLMKDNISPLLQEKRDMGTEMTYPIILQDPWVTPEKGYNPFESRESTLKEIVSVLKEPKDNKIGVYGMPGVGKTTLVKEVLRQVEKVKLFDEMIFIEVTQTVETRMILTKLGHKLGMRFKKIDISEMKMKLHARLKNMEEKILIILDDVWEVPDLETTGILEAVDGGKCKVLLTTRGLDVLTRMGCKVFEIGILSEEESWRLFKNTAWPGHDFIEASEAQPLAKDICKKCGCLPIAIVTLAKALKNECDPRQWEEALQQLNKSSLTNFKGALKMAYLSIELSYNY